MADTELEKRESVRHWALSYEVIGERTSVKAACAIRTSRGVSTTTNITAVNCGRCLGTRVYRYARLVAQRRKTTAQQISKQLGDDGQRFENHDGVSLGDLATEEGVSVSWRDGYRAGDTVRYLFDDGSAITVSGDAWDYGYANCYCWQSVGHSEECLADRNWVDSQVTGDNDWYDTREEAAAALCHFCVERTDERVLVLVRRDEQKQKSYRPSHLSCRAADKLDG